MTARLVDWTPIRPVVAGLRLKNQRRAESAKRVAEVDQVKAAMRTYLNDFGVDIDVDPEVAVFHMLVACLTVERATLQTYRCGGIDRHTADAASWVISHVAEVLVEFLPAEVAR